MTDSQQKTDLLHYLHAGRAALLWKLEGLGEVFGRPFPDPMPWLDDDADIGADMWATADESRAWLTDFYRRVGEHSEATSGQ